MPSLPKDYLRTHKDDLLRKVAEAREYDKAANTFVLVILTKIRDFSDSLNFTDLLYNPL